VEGFSPPSKPISRGHLPANGAFLVLFILLNSHLKKTTIFLPIKGGYYIEIYRVIQLINYHLLKVFPEIAKEWHPNYFCLMCEGDYINT